MNHQTIIALNYIDNFLEVLAEIFQFDHSKNEWFKFNDVQTWSDWSEDWFNYVDCDTAKYGYEMYKILSRMVITPLHTVPTKPTLDYKTVDWGKVGAVIKSRFGS